MSNPGELLIGLNNVLPGREPALVTAGLLAFIFAWNEFLLSITLTSQSSRRPVSAAIAFFTGSSQFQIPIGTITPRPW